MLISVEKLHHEIRLRILSSRRMSEKHREPKGPKGKRPIGRIFDGFARITSKELAITHFVKSGTLQNACSTRTRMVAVLGKSARLHTQPTTRSKTNDDKSAVALLKKEHWQERESVSDACHDRSGKPDKNSGKKLGRNSSKRQLSDARQLGCVFQDMTSSKSILRKSTDMQRPIQRVKFTKAIARHTKIRYKNLCARIHLSR